MRRCAVRTVAVNAVRGVFTRKMIELTTLYTDVLRLPAIFSWMTETLTFKTSPRPRDKRAHIIAGEADFDLSRGKRSIKSQEQAGVWGVRQVFARRKPVYIGNRKFLSLEMVKKDRKVFVFLNGGVNGALGCVPHIIGDGDDRNSSQGCERRQNGTLGSSCSLDQKRSVPH